MKKMLNFEKISHLYLQQKVDGFKELMQKCLEEKNLLKDDKLHLDDNHDISENGFYLVASTDSNIMFMNYKDFDYVRDGYCFSLDVGFDLLDDREITNIIMTKDNRANGIYVYLNKGLKHVLVCGL